MLSTLKSWFGSSKLEAATQIAPLAPPKVRPGVSSFPSYLKTTKPGTDVLPQADRRLANSDTTTLRNGANTRAIIRDFCAASPDLSAARWAYLRIGLPQKYSAVARNTDGSINPEATRLVQELLTRFDLLPDYSEGFTGAQSIRSVSESLALDLIMYGSCGCELVLDKSRLPRRVMPISTTQIQFIADGGGKTLKPIQVIGSEKISLDIPTFLYVALDQDLLSSYSDSPLESALKPVIYSESFASTITRIVGKTLHPRQHVSIDEEAVRRNLSPDSQMDPAKSTEEINAIISSVENKINGLAPEDAIVSLSSLTFSVENPGNSGLSAEYETLQKMAQARLSAGSKTNGTVLGYSAGSSNIASSEIMLMLKSTEGAITRPVEEVWSRALTLSARLFGIECYVEFKFQDIDLRPAGEMVAFAMSKQTMILEQLSLGLIDDMTACLALTGNLPPVGMAPLSGTMFKNAGGGQASIGPNTPSNDGSTLNQNLNSDQPAVGRGQNKRNPQ